MKIKRTWSPCMDREILIIFYEILERSRDLFPTLFNNCTPKLYIDSSTHSLGKCVTQCNKSYTKLDLKQAIRNRTFCYKEAIIVLSKYILADKEKVRATLVHEFGHFVSPAEKHSYVWRANANKIGEVYGITNQRVDDSNTIQNSAEFLKDTKYIIGCPQCHTLWYRQKQTNLVAHPENYVCHNCQKRLVRIK